MSFWRVHCGFVKLVYVATVLDVLITIGIAGWGAVVVTTVVSPPSLWYSAVKLNKNIETDIIFLENQLNKMLKEVHVFLESTLWLCKAGLCCNGVGCVDNHRHSWLRCCGSDNSSIPAVVVVFSCEEKYIRIHFLRTEEDISNRLFLFSKIVLIIFCFVLFEV